MHSAILFSVQIWSDQIEKHTLLENGTDEKMMRLPDLHAVASKNHPQSNHHQTRLANNTA